MTFCHLSKKVSPECVNHLGPVHHPQFSWIGPPRLISPKSFRIHKHNRIWRDSRRKFKFLSKYSYLISSADVGVLWAATNESKTRQQHKHEQNPIESWFLLFWEFIKSVKSLLHILNNFIDRKSEKDKYLSSKSVLVILLEKFIVRRILVFL